MIKNNIFKILIALIFIYVIINKLFLNRNYTTIELFIVTLLFYILLNILKRLKK